MKKGILILCFAFAIVFSASGLFGVRTINLIEDLQPPTATAQLKPLDEIKNSEPWQDVSIVSPLQVPDFSSYQMLKELFMTEKIMLVPVFHKDEAQLVSPILQDQVNWQRMYLELLEVFTQVVKIMPDPGNNGTQTNPGQTDCIPPGKYNLIIVLYDMVHPSQDTEEYANIFIDQKLVGTTNQALQSQLKFVTLSIPAGKHKLEVVKMQYNAVSQDWRRVRNLLQPKAKHIQVSEECIVVVEIIFHQDKEDYSYNARYMTQADLPLFNSP